MSTLVSTSCFNVLIPMAKTVKPLTDTQILAAKPKDARYTLQDGNGLMLYVYPTGIKSWVYRYKDLTKKLIVLTLGQYPALSLANARKQKLEYETIRAEGKDPKEQHNIQKAKLNDSHTLENITRKWLNAYAEKKSLDKNTKHKRLRKFENHLFPRFQGKAIEQIKLRDLKNALNLIYCNSPDNAQRIRADLIQIFGFAVQYGFIEINIARDLEDMDLSAKKKHRATLKSLDQIPILIKRIKADTGHPLTKLCLLLTLHVFIRSSEIRFARWSEIDFDMNQWVLPASRQQVKGVKNSNRGAKMKASHIIPLSKQSIEILREVQRFSGDCDFVFPSPNDKQKFLSENTPLSAIRRMGYTQEELCLHGFRALARSALGEMSLFTRDALEKQMSHMERNSTVDAYTHIAEYLDERRQMMAVWGDWLQLIGGGEYIKPYEYGKSVKEQQNRKLMANIT